MTLQAFSILIVDSDPLSGKFTAETLHNEGYTTCVVKSGDEAVRRLSRKSYHLVITDLGVSPRVDSGLLRHVRSELPHIAVIVVSTEGTIESAVEAIRQGAQDYLAKPFKVEQLRSIVRKTFERHLLLNENRRLKTALGPRLGNVQFIGRSRQIQDLRNIIETVAQSRATVLITGESGVGKEVLATVIHFASQRADGPLVTLNCAAIPAELLESELFGHEKGAFTGAIQSTKGRFEQADGGTLLLDEIGEMSLPMQAKMLRVLQEREFERVGGRKTFRVDVRIIATTNRNLPERIREGTFREDLFFRLNVIPLHIPPLRERTEDIPLLANHFLARLAESYLAAPKVIPPDSLDRMLAYPWPGNVRELQNLLERAFVLSPGESLRIAELIPASTTGTVQTEGISMPVRPGKTLAEYEREIILATLRLMGGNRTHTAEALDISIRTLRYKLKQYRLADVDSGD